MDEVNWTRRLQVFHLEFHRRANVQRIKSEIIRSCDSAAVSEIESAANIERILICDLKTCLALVQPVGLADRNSIAFFGRQTDPGRNSNPDSDVNFLCLKPSDSSIDQASTFLDHPRESGCGDPYH